MSLTVEEKRKLVEDHRTHEQDTGSAEVQVALLTRRITMLTGHMQRNKHDFHSRRGLIMLVGKRNRLLRYLRQRDRQRYLNLIGRLGLRK